MARIVIHKKMFQPRDHALCGTKHGILNIWSDRVTCKKCLKLMRKRG